MSMMQERAHEIVAHLTGSCSDVKALLEEGESEDDAVLIETLDDNVFLCDSCGWWHELEEMVDSPFEQVCTQCKEHE